MGTYGQIFIDSDNNSTTGYIDGTWTTTGIDYMIENRNLNSHLVHDNSWKWTGLGTTNVSVSNNTTVYEARVAKTALSGLSTSIKVGFKDVNSSWNTVCMLSASGVLPVYTLK